MIRLAVNSGRRPALVALALAGSLFLGVAAARATPARVAQPLAPAWKLCAKAVAAAERRHRIPGQLMAAMALAESGRYHVGRKATFAWPWTVTSGKNTWFLPDRRAAIARVRALESHGVRNIDVGCMQVNLAWHGDAFADLETAFDPDANAAFAARHLAGLFDARRSWALAVGLYHSATRPLRLRYQRKVLGLWRITRRRAAEARRMAAIAAYKARRHARLEALARRRADRRAAAEEAERVD